MRGLISPTIIKCIMIDPLWHQKYIAAFGGHNEFDCDGFDQFGYNQEGYDRNGKQPSSYFYQQAYDEDDFEYDLGCQNFLDSYHLYTVFYIDNNIIMPIKNSYQYQYENKLNSNSILEQNPIINEDGIFYF